MPDVLSRAAGFRTLAAALGAAWLLAGCVPAGTRVNPDRARCTSPESVNDCPRVPAQQDGTSQQDEDFPPRPPPARFSDLPADPSNTRPPDVLDLSTVSAVTVSEADEALVPDPAPVLASRDETGAPALPNRAAPPPGIQAPALRLVAATYFGPGDHRLSRKAQRALDEVVQLLRSTPYGRIVVAGYADGTGQRGEGARVAARRAASVRAHLVARGIAAERIEQETHSADPLAGSGTACTRRTAKARQACAQARGRTDVRVYGLESAGAAATGGGRVRPQ